MLLMPVIFVAILVLAFLGGVLRVAGPLILAAAELRRQRAALNAMLPAVPNGAVQNAAPQPVLPTSPVVQPHVVLPPGPPPSAGGNIYMPGGPAVVGGRVFVPGMTPKWPRKR